jgi:4-amino-4-deoxy-L-arabinose transferase-like glycosyltransferase
MVKKISLFVKQNWLILLIWVLGLFLRCYRQGDLLGFYYDQGRDAQIAADIISLKNFPAIGPTTGIAGLYLGPFWYYLITPGYFIGRGNPAFASLFIIFIESLSIPLIYFLLKKYFNTRTAVLGAVFWAFSRYLIHSSRWFSNPSPLPTFVLIIMLFTLKIIVYKKYKYLPLLFLFLGLSLQLEAASAIFFFPVLIVFLLLSKKIIKNIHYEFWIQSILIFGALLIPQLAFEVKNSFPTTKTLIGFLSGQVNSLSGSSFTVTGLPFLIERLRFYYQVFFTKLDTDLTHWSLLALTYFLLTLFFKTKKLWSNPLFKLTFLWLFVPLVLLLFFVGNYGRLYDYYLTGYFPAFIILFSVLLNSFSFPLSFLLPSLSLLYYINGNYIHLKNFLSAGIDGPTHITLGNSLFAVRQACQENVKEVGTLDIYVPPVTPTSYDYLVSKLCPAFISNSSVRYLIYEVDTENPDKLSSWLSKYSQDKLIISSRLGGVTFEKRFRK